jgi:hypothetical protein
LIFMGLPDVPARSAASNARAVTLALEASILAADTKVLQTVRKLQDLSIKWRKERAGRNFSRFAPLAV